METTSRHQRNDTRRVQIFSESALPLANGVARSVKQILKGFHELGYEAEAVTPKPLPEDKAYDGYHVRSVSSLRAPGHDFRYGNPSAGKVRSLIDAFKPELVYVASPTWQLGKAAVRGAREHNLPVVSAYQTDVAQYAHRLAQTKADQLIGREVKWLRDGAGESFETLFGRQIARIHNKSTLTLAPSQPAMDRLESFGVDMSRVRLWGRGVDTELFTPDRKASETVQTQRAAWSHDGTRPIVGYVGRLAPEKRVDRLKILEETNAQVVIVGGGSMEHQLKKELGSFALFTGELTGDALADAYASFDMFVHTGTNETFGQAPQEAMATGLPVIGPASGGILERVEDGVTGLLYHPESDRELLEAIQKLIADTALANAMGQAGYEKVKANTWSGAVGKLVEYFDEATVLHKRKHKK